MLGFYNGDAGATLLLISMDGRRGTYICYWWEMQKEKDHYEGKDVGGWKILRCILDR
jgi:hypothetical protein